MEITLTTPALLFPTISLLLLAYTNRFLGIAGRIRDLHSKYRTSNDALLIRQIENLRRRVMLIRNMQAIGILSLLLCVLCMFLLFAGYATLGKYVFGVSLLLLAASLAISLLEIQISTVAINLELSDLASSERPSARNEPAKRDVARGKAAKKKE